MTKKFTDNSLQFTEKNKSTFCFPLSTFNRKRSTGFTLIETLVAISLLTVAIITPMQLVAQSLAAAAYSRDQVTAYNLAQEGIESVRAIRDGNVLANALQSSGRNLLQGIPTGANFTIDSRTDDTQTCAGVCPALQTDGTLYGYDPTWATTNFTRTMTAVFVGPASGFDSTDRTQDVIRVSATVSWTTPNGQSRSFTIYENMYRWVNDGSAAQ